MPEITAPGANPLQKYFRQPKLYIDIPSKGMFYPEGSIDFPDNGELAVYPMTAKDELAIKTPDALLNGQATVDVIQSCIPQIKDAWLMPTLDLDAILIAIRIATYGENLDLQIKVPQIGDEKSFTVDLRNILHELTNEIYDSTISYENMIVHTRPLSYREFTKSSLKTFEEQRVYSIINDESIPDQEKLEKFNQSFAKLNDLTVQTVVQSIEKITLEDQVVTNQLHIEEFIRNSEKEVFNIVFSHLNKQKEKYAIKPFTAHSSPDEIERGAPETYTVPITFDQSNFFE